MNPKPMPAIKERPILFNAEMVRAILKNKKSQTRRVIKPQPEGGIDRYVQSLDKNYWLPNGILIKDPSGVFGRGPLEIRENSMPVKCPYGKIGDRLWVREPWRGGNDTLESVFYRADDSLASTPIYQNIGAKWKPSIHMPRWASRINLEITDIRVERVQDIKKSGVYAEGVIERDRPDEFSADSVLSVDGKGYLSWATAWISLWNSINEKRGYGWEKNPWVWCLTFKGCE